MSMLNLSIPRSLREQVEALAAREGVSVGEFASLALAEKVATLTTADYLAERGAAWEPGQAAGGAGEGAGRGAGGTRPAVNVPEPAGSDVSRLDADLRIPAARWAETDLGAIRHNLRRLVEPLGGTEHVMGVVKADAYGHGAVPVARVLAEEGVEILAVATIPEAVRAARGRPRRPRAGAGRAAARRPGPPTGAWAWRPSCRRPRSPTP